MLKIIDKIKRNIDYKKLNKLFSKIDDDKYLPYGFIDNIKLEDLYFVDSFIEFFTMKIVNKEIGIRQSIEILDNFYESSYPNLKTKVFILVLKKIYKDSTFIDGYCYKSFYQFPLTFKISDDFLSELMDIYIEILELYTNKLSNDILRIIIYNLHMNTLICKNNINRLLNITWGKLNELKKLADNKIKIKDDIVIQNYSLYIKLSKIICNNDIVDIIKKINLINLADELKLDIIEFLLINKEKIPKDIIEKLFKKKKTKNRILELLERYSAMELMPADSKITQEEIAINNMIEWLEYPTELGRTPVDLKIIDRIINDGYCYYIFSFKSPENLKKGPMIAVSRGYMVGNISTEGIGYDYSNFEEITDNYIEQVNKIFEALKKMSDD